MKHEPTTTPPLSPADITKAEPVPKAWALPEPSDPAMRSHVRNWQAHLDAGRIGSKSQAAPHVIATREANARLFARRAARR